MVMASRHETATSRRTRPGNHCIDEKTICWRKEKRAERKKKENEGSVNKHRVPLENALQKCPTWSVDGQNCLRRNI